MSEELEELQSGGREVEATNECHVQSAAKRSTPRSALCSQARRRQRRRRRKDRYDIKECNQQSQPNRTS